MFSLGLTVTPAQTELGLAQLQLVLSNISTREEGRIPIIFVKLRYSPNILITAHDDYILLNF